MGDSDHLCGCRVSFDVAWLSSASLSMFTCCCDQTLNSIEENYGVSLDLSTEGRAVVFSDHADSVKKAVKLVRELVQEIQEVREPAIQQKTN